MKRKIEFNNGFVTAIALFLIHRDNDVIRQYRIENNLSDHRMYTGSDHLYDLEIPKEFSKKHPKLTKRILNWRSRCFANRLSMNSALNTKKQFEINDKLFDEGINILAAIDNTTFKIKKVVMYYR